MILRSKIQTPRSQQFWRTAVIPLYKLTPAVISGSKIKTPRSHQEVFHTRRSQQFWRTAVISRSEIQTQRSQQDPIKIAFFLSLSRLPLCGGNYSTRFRCSVCCSSADFWCGLAQHLAFILSLVLQANLSFKEKKSSEVGHNSLPFQHAWLQSSCIALGFAAASTSREPQDAVIGCRMPYWLLFAGCLHRCRMPGWLLSSNLASASSGLLRYHPRPRWSDARLGLRRIQPRDFLLTPPDAEPACASSESDLL